MELPVMARDEDEVAVHADHPSGAGAAGDGVTGEEVRDGGGKTETGRAPKGGLLIALKIQWKPFGWAPDALPAAVRTVRPIRPSVEAG